MLFSWCHLKSGMKNTKVKKATNLKILRNRLQVNFSPIFFNDLIKFKIKIEGNMEKSQRTNLMNKLFSVLKMEDLSDCAAFYFKKILYALLNQKGFEV